MGWSSPSLLEMFSHHVLQRRTCDLLSAIEAAVPVHATSSAGDLLLPGLPLSTPERRRSLWQRRRTEERRMGSTSAPELMRRHHIGDLAGDVETLAAYAERLELELVELRRFRDQLEAALEFSPENINGDWIDSELSYVDLPEGHGSATWPHWGNL